MSDSNEVYTTYELDLYRLFEPVPNVEKKFSQLSFGAREGRPRISVFTNYPEDKVAGGNMSISFRATDFFAFLAAFKKTTEVNSPTELIFEDAAEYKNDKQSEPRAKVALHCGRDEEGIYWISLKANGRPIIKFLIRKSFNFRIKVGDKPLPPDQESKIYTKVYLDKIEQLMLQLTNRTRSYTTPVPISQQGKSNYKSNQKQKTVELQQHKEEPSFEDLGF